MRWSASGHGAGRPSSARPLRGALQVLTSAWSPLVALYGGLVVFAAAWTWLNTPIRKLVSKVEAHDQALFEPDRSNRSLVERVESFESQIGELAPLPELMGQMQVALDREIAARQKYAGSQRRLLEKVRDVLERIGDGTGAGSRPSGGR